MLRRTVVGAASLALVAFAGLLGPTGAGSAAADAVTGARWASPAKATIKPGVQMYTRGAQCTANFVFTDRRGRVYVGYAAHCAGLGESTDTDGCKVDSYPIGTLVRFARGGAPWSDGEVVGRGRLAYSSWITMRLLGEKRYNPCQYNDFALVRVAREYVGKVSPTMPYWGGPTALHTGTTDPGEQVYSYGNSSLRGGEETLSPKEGTSLGTTGGGWTHDVYTATPGIPGDSGSGFLSSDGRAFGVLSTLALAPLPASNGVSDLGRMLTYAKRHSGIPGLRLVTGTRPFSTR